MSDWKVGQIVANVCGGMVYDKLTIIAVGSRKIKTNDNSEWSVNGRRYGSSRDSYYNANQIAPWSERHERIWLHARLWNRARSLWISIERRKDEIANDELSVLVKALNDCASVLEASKKTE